VRLLFKSLSYIFAPPIFGNIVLLYKIKKVDTLSYKTVSINKENAEKKWLLVDAEGETLGRMASKVAQLIRGKHKPNFTPHVDCGDNVIVINAEKVSLSGNKWATKTYIRHTGFPGGQRSLTAEQLREKRPERLVEMAVKRMLPKTKLGNQLYRNLKVVVGTDHDHDAQKPEKINLESIK
jgi:large subunit ribosomal protein L13